jgi:hypothetical protein
VGGVKSYGLKLTGVACGRSEILWSITIRWDSSEFCKKKKLSEIDPKGDVISLELEA